MLCSSFSKCLSPALRIGFVAAGRYRAAGRLQKTVTSGGTNPITQMVLAEYLESGAYERHLRGLRRTYERQVDAMRAAVARHFPPPRASRNRRAASSCGSSCPTEVDTTALHDRAIAAGVAYVPGRALFGQRHVSQLPATQLRQPAHPRDRGRRAAPRRAGRVVTSGRAPAVTALATVSTGGHSSIGTALNASLASSLSARRSSAG
jgi:DNA-binding transcriptional MocR family regulator